MEKVKNQISSEEKILLVDHQTSRKGKCSTITTQELLEHHIIKTLVKIVYLSGAAIVRHFLT